MKKWANVLHIAQWKLDPDGFRYNKKMDPNQKKKKNTKNRVRFGSV